VDCLNLPVKSVSDYISEIEKKLKQTKVDHTITVFRGESKVYDTPCQPNIFRTPLSQSDRFFEKNLFDEMSANHLTDGKTYLEIAIDAQHGGFPSRLLDVTYNCIVALYFAITPYYTESETSHDNEDGIVYIFFLEDIYCPTGNNINQAYNACIDHNSDWFSDQELFQKNHKLIDHIKKNPRIIAQQGAFILFQGEHLSSFPRYRYETVRIDKSAKAQLRNDLRLYFGIHTGSIYPEEFNLVHEMIRKSKNVSSGSFSLENELKLIFHNIEKLSEYYLDELEVASKDEYQQIIKTAEAELFDYHLRLKSFLDHLECHSNVNKDYKDYKDYKVDCQRWKETFNSLINNFADTAEALMQEYPDSAIQICRRELLL
jgi:hypothetical protein